MASSVQQDPPHRSSDKDRLSERPTVTADDPAAFLTTPPPSSAQYRNAQASIPLSIDGRYAVESVLGEGTAGVVYLCRHLVIDKRVAIKVLRNDFAHDANVADRFVNEARAATAIGSDHIVETLDFGHTEDGSTFIVMEYLEGESLGELLEREGSLAFERIVRLMRQLATGLAAAHAAGIIHRDVKPDNLFVIQRDGAEFLKILDFGVAKMASAQGALTRAGSIFGTPHYMSPEQAAGRSADVRADIYSLGVLLYEMAAGQVPFDAEAPLAILTQHLQDAPPKLRVAPTSTEVLPEGYEAIVLKCMSKEPDERYQTMAQLDEELAILESGLSPQAVVEIAERERLASLHPKPERTRASGALYALAASVLLVGFGALFLISGRGVTSSLGLGVEPTVSAPTRVSAAPVPLLPPLPAEVAEEPAGVKVDLVLFPLNAHVFLGDEDLGRMPLSVFVPSGETVTLMVKHKGYIARKLELDGTKSRVVVGLKHWTESKWGKAKLESEKNSP